MESKVIEKIEQWFIEEIEENISWSGADVSVNMINEIAKEKTKDLIRKCFVEENMDE